MTDTTITPSRLWKRMTADQRRRAGAALWAADDNVNEQRQVALLVAKQLKFRPKTMNALDADRKARYLANVAELPDEMAARLLVLYHVAEQQPMMGAFLDALGIAHENGMIKDDAATADPSKIRAAVAAISGQYPASDVSLYLDTLVSQDPVSWGALLELPSVSR